MVSICRDELDRLRGCDFIAHCHQARQELHHRLNLRGRRCCFWVMLSDTLLEPPLTPEQRERRAIEDEAPPPPRTA